MREITPLELFTLVKERFRFNENPSLLKLFLDAYNTLEAEAYEEYKRHLDAKLEHITLHFKAQEALAEQQRLEKSATRSAAAGAYFELFKAHEAAMEQEVNKRAAAKSEASEFAMVGAVKAVVAKRQASRVSREAASRARGVRAGVAIAKAAAARSREGSGESAGTGEGAGAGIEQNEPKDPRLLSPWLGVPKRISVEDRDGKATMVTTGIPSSVSSGGGEKLTVVTTDIPSSVLPQTEAAPLSPWLRVAKRISVGYEAKDVKTENVASETKTAQEKVKPKEPKLLPPWLRVAKRISAADEKTVSETKKDKRV